MTYDDGSISHSIFTMLAAKICLDEFHYFLCLDYNLDNYAYNIAIYVTLHEERYACVVRKFRLISYAV